MASALHLCNVSLPLDQVWRGEDMARVEGVLASTGFESLDVELPGGGWPVGAMTEILHAGPAACTWQLLLPALAQAVAQRRAPVVLVGAPHAPFAPALAAQGVPAASLLWVRCDAQPARLWATEQALRCADVSAVLAWLPQARSSELRRLQLAAAQHESLLWVFRPISVAQSASPARLRLEVVADPQHDGQLQVHILKRRGPPLARPILLPAHSARLAALLAAEKMQRAMGVSTSLHFQTQTQTQQQQTKLQPPVLLPHLASAAVLRFHNGRVSHAVDRLAVAA